MDKLFDKISNDPFYENELPNQDGQSTKNNLANEEAAAKKRQEELENQHLFLNDKQLDWLYIDGSDDDADDAMSAPTTNLHNILIKNKWSESKRPFIAQMTSKAMASTINSSKHTASYQLPLS
ncbi:unnamed protein product [Absidia cylindrospora]